MRPFDPSSLLPEFASEHAAGEAELAELLADFAVVLASDVSAADALPGRARLLRALAPLSERLTPLFDRLAAFFDLSVAALQEVLARAERASEWQPGPLPGVALFHLSGGPAVAAFDTGLVTLKRGMTFPLHRHTGSERVLILQGGYHDDHERRWVGPGEVHEMAQGSQHSLRMSADEDVLFAIILSGEIQLLGAP